MGGSRESPFFVYQNMDILIFITLLLNTGFTFLLAVRQRKTADYHHQEQLTALGIVNDSVKVVNDGLKKVETNLLVVHKRIDQIFAVDNPSANQAMEKDESNIEFNEQNIMNVPADVKLEVEGGDSPVPPGYTEVPN